MENSISSKMSVMTLLHSHDEILYQKIFLTYIPHFTNCVGPRIQVQIAIYRALGQQKKRSLVDPYNIFGLEKN